MKIIYEYTLLKFDRWMFREESWKCRGRYALALHQGKVHKWRTIQSYLHKGQNRRNHLQTKFSIHVQHIRRCFICYSGRSLLRVVSSLIELACLRIYQRLLPLLLQFNHSRPLQCPKVIWTFSSFHLLFFCLLRYMPPLPHKGFRSDHHFL